MQGGAEGQWRQPLCPRRAASRWAMPARRGQAPRAGPRQQALARCAAGDREDRQHAVADELQHPRRRRRRTRPGDAVEPGMERGDDRRGRRSLSERAVKPRRSAPERSRPRMVSPAPRRSATGLRPGGAAPAEIGLEQCRQRWRAPTRAARGAAAKRAAWRSPARLDGARTEHAVPAQASDRPVQPRSDGCSHALAPVGERPAPGQAPADQSRRGLAESDRRRSPRASITAHGLGPPEPGAAGDERVRRRERQGAAGERQAVVASSRRADLGQEPVGAGRGAGVVREPASSEPRTDRSAEPCRDHAAPAPGLSSAPR